MSVAARLLGTTLILLLSACALHRDDAENFDRCAGDWRYYVVNHGWHAGLVIEAPPLTTRVPSLQEHFDAAGYLEFGWGDERFYQSPRPGPGLMLAAALWPTATVLHVANFPGSPAPQTNLLEIRTDATGYQQLLDFVATSFEHDYGVAPIGPGLYGDGRFYRAVGSFHLFNNCNTWVAKAVRASGVPLPGARVITAEDLMGQLRAVAVGDCPAS